MKAVELSSEHWLLIIVLIIVINLLLLLLIVTCNIMILSSVESFVHVLVVIIADFSIFSLILAYLLNLIRSRVQNLVGLFDLALNHALEAAHLLGILAAT